jgi:hypothetical protein
MMAATYQIRVQGLFDPSFSAWFNNFAVAHTAEGDTLLTGEVVDQAALHGILARCRDLGVTLISVNPLADQEGEQK